MFYNSFFDSICERIKHDNIKKQKLNKICEFSIYDRIASIFI